MFILFSCTMLCDRLILIFDVVTLTDILVTWPWYIYTGTCHATLITLYLTLYLPCCTYHLISDTGTYHIILDGWRAITHLTCYPLVLVYLTWYCDTWLDTIIPDTCITWHIHDYHFYGDMACYYTMTRPRVLLNSCTAELLNHCTPELMYPLYSCPLHCYSC